MTPIIMALASLAMVDGTLQNEVNKVKIIIENNPKIELELSTISCNWIDYWADGYRLEDQLNHKTVARALSYRENGLIENFRQYLYRAIEHWENKDPWKHISLKQKIDILVARGYALKFVENTKRVIDGNKPVDSIGREKLKNHPDWKFYPNGTRSIILRRSGIKEPED